MNQQIPTGRPSQRAPQQTPPRSPQRPQQRPPQRPPQRPHRPSKYGTGFVVLLVTTVTLLLISLIVLGVVLCVGGMDSAPQSTGGGGDDTSTTPKQETPQTPTTPQLKAKYLTLPSATASGNQLSAPSVDVQQISGISSGYAVLVDMASNQSIAEKYADAKVYPASMTKVMTVLIACENAKSATDLVTVEQWMLDYLKKGQPGYQASTIGGWTAGDSITVEDALFLVNYQSDTIACLLLAEYIAGGNEEFAAMMNQKARSMGLTGTNFVNNTGLYDDNHYTTCRDMAAIVRAAMNNPAAKAVLTSYQGYSVSIYRDSALTRNPTIYAAWYSDKDRLGDNAWVGGGSDMKFVGGKTGYEDVPTACFATVAQDTGTGKYYICVTVGRGSTSNSSVNEASSTADAKHIYKTYAEGRT